MAKFPIKFGRYLLTEKIGTGGMAEIFKAKLLGIEGFEKIVAIKRILSFWSERREFIEMLVDEAKVLVHLNHPNIVQVLELGRVEDDYFIAMEFVDGLDLKRFLNIHQFSLHSAEDQKVILSIMLEVLEGLIYAHNRVVPGQGALGVIHRDVSPQNILLSIHGEVKVTDFGIAKAVTQSHETQTGILKGKYAYMSPEQAFGKVMDARSDMFSWAVVLYELLFQRRPFDGTTDIELIDQVRICKVDYPREQAALLFPGVLEVLQRILQREPSARFQESSEILERIENAIPGQRRLSQIQLSAYFQKAFQEKSKLELREQENLRTASLVQTQSGSFVRKKPRTLLLPGNLEDTVALDESMFEAQAEKSRQENTITHPHQVTFAQAEDSIFKKINNSFARKPGFFYKIVAVSLLISFSIFFIIFQSDIFTNKTNTLNKSINKKTDFFQGEDEKNVQESSARRVHQAQIHKTPLVALTELTAQEFDKLITAFSLFKDEYLAAIFNSELISFSIQAQPPTAKVTSFFRGKKLESQGGLQFQDIIVPSAQLGHKLGFELTNKCVVEVSHPGYQTQKLTLLLDKNMRDKVKKIELEKEAPKYGFLRVNAANKWAKVFVKNYVSGRATPVGPVKLPVGKYRIIVKSPDGKTSASGTASIRANKNTHCVASLSQGTSSLSCR